MSEALRLAESLEMPFQNAYDRAKAAKELRRQHAEIERLRALNAEMLEALRRGEKTLRLYPAWAGHADDFAQLIAKAEAASNGQ